MTSTPLHPSALILDLDGTAVPNRYDGMPSEAVIQAVRKAQALLPVAVATGRPWSDARAPLTSLGITSPCVITGGAQIVDPRDGAVRWEQKLAVSQIERVIETLEPFHHELYFTDEATIVDARRHTALLPEHILYVTGVALGDATAVLERVGALAGVSIVNVPPYAAGTASFHVTHEAATKEQALSLLFQMLEADPQQAIGIGDGDNDLPLFRVVGTKVAMGNATELLKAKADVVAPDIDHDGVAWAIERLILTPEKKKPS